MPPKRKFAEVVDLATPSTSRRSTRSVIAPVDPSITEDYSGLNGGYWSPSKRSTRATRAVKRDDDEGSLKENGDATTASANVDSEDELPVIPVRPRKAGLGHSSISINASSAFTPTPRASPAKKSIRTYARSVSQRHATEASELEDELPIILERHSRNPLVVESALSPAPLTTPSRRQRGSATTLAAAKSTKATHRTSSPPEEPTSEDRAATPVSPTKRGRRAAQTKTMDEAAAEEQSSASVINTMTPKKPTRKAQPQPETGIPTPESLLQSPVEPQPTAEEPNALPVVQPASPRKPIRAASPTRLPRPLPSQLLSHLSAQKAAIFKALRYPLTVSSPTEETKSKGDMSSRDLAYSQLHALMKGTVERGEGNSCMLIGPRGSGKTLMVEQLISELAPNSSFNSGPIIIRLSGHVQHNDRLAMREIVRQLVLQTDLATFDMPPDEDDDEQEKEATGAGLVADPDENPFLDDSNSNNKGDGGPSSGATAGVSVRMPPTAHLPSLIGTLPTLGRPVVIVLDSFDLFALHARQALLYCLLDTVQHSQAVTFGAHYEQAASTSSPSKGKGKSKAEQHTSNGLAIIGVTTRVDTLELLEKRVKSRFSGRIMRTAVPPGWDAWSKSIRAVLDVPLPSTSPLLSGGAHEDGEDEEGSRAQWEGMWASAVDRFMEAADVRGAFEESMALVRDMGLISRVLLGLAVSLSIENPWPTFDMLKRAFGTQRCPPRFANLSTLHYPAICLLIGAIHARTAGHEQVTFEQLHNDFREEVRKSMAAPVQMRGASIGMVRCGRGVLLGAFEQLVSMRIFVPVGAAAGSASLSREFIKYRCVPEREDVKRAVEKVGQTNLKKWFAKAS